MHLLQVAMMLLTSQQFTVSVAPAVPSFTVSVEPVSEPAGVSSTRQWYLVSESWCQNCPAAKRRFLGKGWPESNILTIAECESRFGFRPPHVPFEFGEPVSQSQQVIQPAEIPGRYAVWQGQKYDMEKFRPCGSRRCNMCANLSAAKQRYEQAKAAAYQKTSFIPDHQQPTPDDIIDKMLALMSLTPTDVLADLGCGDGRILIEAAKRYGCRGVGVEIDPSRADEARRQVAAAGMTDRIEIITGDAVDFEPAAYSVTAITAYLYPSVLEKLTEKFRAVRVGASPFHEVPGLGMEQRGDVWLWVNPYNGVPGSHADRESLIDHMLTFGIHPSERHTRAELEALTDMALDAMHTRDHERHGQVKEVTQSAFVPMNSTAVRQSGGLFRRSRRR